MKKVSTNPNIIKPLTKDVIRKELSDDKQNFFFIESHQLYEIFKYTIPEYLQNLGVTIEEKPC
ncbi:MAG: hypothetical protein IJ638_03230, partial [Alphaproteobacteria bacterium]|nr:hypothetical protein [Alphaproteobacteria bacterium]